MDDNTAISPVIGTFLMITLTIIGCAAVSVYTLGFESPDPAPFVKLELSDGKVDDVGESVSRDVKVEHVYGEDLIFSELKVEWRRSNQDVNWHPGRFTGEPYKGLTNFYPFTVGDTCYIDDLGGSSQVFETGFHDLRITHIPTGYILVDVRDLMVELSF